MTVLQILQQCKERNIKLESDSNNLVVNAPKGAIDDALRSALKKMKSELLPLVSSATQEATTPLREAGKKPPLRFALSAYQRQFWAASQDGNPNNTALAIAEAFDLETRITQEELRHAVDLVVARHDMLRMRLETDEQGEPVQVIRDRATAPLMARNILPDADETAREHEVQNIFRELMAVPYDLKNDTPLRIGLINAPSGNSTIVIGIPHIVGDALSLNVILKDLLRFLPSDAPQEKNDNTTPQPEESPIQYGEYLRWLDTHVSPKETQDHLAYWIEHLRHLPPLHSLPTDYSRPYDKTQGEFQFVTLTLPGAEALKTELRNMGVSPFLYFQTAMRIALYRFGGVDDIPIVTPVANRHRFSELDSTVGCFANEAVLNIPLNPNASMEHALRAGRETLVQALEHQETPFTQVIEKLCHQRTPDWLPVAQIFFSYIGLAEDLPARHRFDHIACPSYDLSFIVADCKEHFRFMLGYDAALYTRQTARSLGTLFTQVCEAMHRSPQTSPAALSLNETHAREESMVPAADPAAALAKLLFPHPDEPAYFLTEEKAPVLTSIKEMARKAGTEVIEIPAISWPENSDPKTLVTTRHPSRLDSLLPVNDRTPFPRLCLVNNLPSPTLLRRLSERGLTGHVVLELPSGNESATPDFWTASLDTFGLLRDEERFIAGTAFPEVSNTVPGERILLAPDAYALQGENNTIKLPLPDASVAQAWHEGHLLHLNLLAAKWTQAHGTPCALTLAPNPAEPENGEELTVWWVRGDNSRNLPKEPNSFERPEGWPEKWPDHQVSLSALPTTSKGKIDRHALAQLPLISEKRLADAEKTFTRTGHTGIALRPVKGKHPIPVLHHSDMLPNDSDLTIQEGYSSLGVAAKDLGETSQKRLSIVHGAPLSTAINVSFREHMERFHNELIFIDTDGQETTFQGPKFLEQARRLLSGMQKNGLAAGTRAILYCSREQEMLALAWACLLGGVHMTALLPPREGQNPIPTQTRLGHMLAILDNPAVITTQGTAIPFDSCPVLLFDDLLREGQAQKNEPIFFETKPDSPVYTAFTSGSTGVPKAVPLNANNLFSVMYGRRQRLGPIANETALSITALDHVGSMFGQSFFSTLRGARQVYSSFPHILANPVRVLDIIHKHRVSHTWAPDFLWRHLYEWLNKLETPQGNWDLSCMTHLISGGENTREATFINLAKCLVPHQLSPNAFAHCWGMSETSSFYTMSDPWDGKNHETHLGIVDAGPPLPGMSFRIVDKNNNPVPEGVMGAFHVSGPGVIKEYYDNPEANAEGFSSDGWFITGDIAMIKNGKVIFCGREKEQVVINGQNISQFDIEGFVDGIKGVEPTFSVVLGCRNNASGDEDVLVFAHTAQTAPKERAAVIRRINAALSSHYGITPKHVLLVDKSDVPKAILGKIQRVTVLKRFLSGGFQRQIRESDILLQNDNTVPDWFLYKEWSRADLPPVSRTDLRKLAYGQRFLVTGNDQDFNKALAERLLAHGTRVEQLEQIDSDTGFDETGTIVFTLGREPAPSLSREWMPQSFEPLYSLMASLAGRPSPQKLVVVTIQGQLLAQDQTVSLLSSSVNGLAASLARQTNSDVKVVDIQDNASETGGVRAVCEELLFDGHDKFCAWRNGLRYIPLLRPVKFCPETTATTEAPLFLQEHFCLCTGFTGRIGRTLLPQLLALTKGNFLLVGRKSPESALAHFTPDEKEQWTTRVHYVQASLDDATALEDALRVGSTHFSRLQDQQVTAGGVLHLAADTGERDFQDLSGEQLAAGLGQRLRHLESLETACARQHVTGPRVVFSSVMSFWGGAESALYAPSCALAESFAQNNSRWRCFAWSRWQDQTKQDTYLSNILKQRGFLTIDARRGAISLLAMLRQPAEKNEALLMAGVDRRAPGVSMHMHQPGHAVHPTMELEAFLTQEGTTAVLRGLLNKAVGRNVRFNVSHLETPNYDRQGRLIIPSAHAEGKSSVPEDKAHPALEQRMSTIWREVLQLNLLDPKATFFELGGTSVHVPRLREKVLAEFGVDVGSVGVFHYPSVHDMCSAVSSSAAEIPPQQPEDGASTRAAKQRQARASRS